MCWLCWDEKVKTNHTRNQKNRRMVFIQQPENQPDETKKIEMVTR